MIESASGAVSSDLAHATPGLSGVSRAVIPTTMGDIAEMYAPSKSSRLIYHLQDVHNHISAQTNLYGMVSALESHAAKRGKALLVLVEGVTGPVDTDAVAAIADEQAKEAVGAGLLRAGFLLGEEYAAITRSPGRIRLVGVESPGLYVQNTLAEELSSSARVRVLSTVREIRRQLEKLKEHNFNATLAELESKRLQVESGALAITDYLRFLEKVNPAVVRQYPDIERMIGVTRREAGVDFGQVEKESRQLIAELMKKKSDKDVRAMVEQAQALKAGTLSPLSYYSQLLRQADRPYASVEAYVAYLREAEKISPEGLFDQILEAEVKVAEGLLRHPMAIDLYKKIRWIERQEKFFSLKMIPQEWARQRDTTLSGFEAEHALIRVYVAEQTQAMGYSFEIPSFTGSDLRVAVHGARVYYQAAEARDAAMVKNIETVLAQYPESQYEVAYVAGGFHTPGITQIFRKRGLAYAVVRPQLETQIELNDEYDFPAFREAEDEARSSRNDFRREMGGVSAAGGAAVAETVTNPEPAVVQTTFARARAARQAALNRPNRRAGNVNIGVLFILTGIAGIAIFGLNAPALMADGMRSFVDFASTAQGIAIVLGVGLIAAALIHALVNRMFFPRQIQNRHDEIDGLELSAEQKTATKTNLYVSDLEKAGHIDPVRLADARDYAYVRGKRLAIVPDTNREGVTEQVREDETFVYVPARHIVQLGADVISRISVALRLTPTPKHVLPAGGSGQWNGGNDRFGLPLTPAMEARAAIVRAAGNRGVEVAKRIQQRQMDERDADYLRQVNDKIASVEFQDRVAAAFPNIFGATAPEGQREDVRQLPAVLQKWFNESHRQTRRANESQEEFETSRHQAGERFRDVVELTTAIEGLTPADIRFDAKLPSSSEVNGNDYTFNSTFHAPNVAPSQPYEASPRDGQGDVLTSGQFKDKVRDAKTDLVTRELIGDVYTRVSLGGNARRFDLPEDFPAALLTPRIALAKLQELYAKRGISKPLPNLPPHADVPMFARFILARLAYIATKAEERGFPVDAALANQHFILEVSEKNAAKIYGYVVAAKFFGLGSSNFLYTEQESIDGFGLQGGQFVPASRIPALKEQSLENGSQGHGAMEDRSRLPNNVFTVSASGQRTYLGQTLYDFVAAQGAVISSFQLSMNDAMDPAYHEDTELVAIGLGASAAGINVTAFRLDPTDTKGGTLVYIPKFPEAFKRFLGTTREGGYVVLESSILKGPIGKAIKDAVDAYKKENRADKGVVNAGITITDPRVLLAVVAEGRRHNLIVAARGVKGQTSEKLNLLNVMLHWDLWRYEITNRDNDFKVIQENWERDEIKELGKDGAPVENHFDHLNASDRVGGNPHFERGLTEAQRNVPTVAFISASPFIAAGLLALSLGALAVLYGLGVTSVILQIFAVGFGAGVGLIGAFGAVVGLAAVALARSNAKVISEITLEQAYADYEALGLDKTLVEDAIIAIGKLKSRDPNVTFEVRVAAGGYAHVDYEKGILYIGAGLLARSNGLTRLVRRELLLSSVSHEYDHLDRAVNAPATVANRAIDEIYAYPRGVARYLALRLGGGFGLRQARNANQTFVGSAVDGAAADKEKKRQQFVGDFNERIPQYKNKSVSGTVNLVINPQYLPTSGPELKAYLDDAVAHARSLIIRSMQGESSPRGVQITILDTDGMGTAQVAFDAFNQLKSLNEGEARMSVGVHMVGYAQMSAQAADLDEGKIDLSAVVKSVPELNGIEFDLGSNVFVLSGIDAPVNTFGARTLQFNSRLQLALQLFAYSRYVNPTTILEFMSALIFRVYKIRVEERTQQAIDEELQAAIMA